MCGRYTAFWERAAFEKTFNVQDPLFKHWNIAPTQFAPIVYQPGGARETLNARWGLIPSWVKNPDEFKGNLFNAKAETLHEKPSFKTPYKRQRCIVPASGFYEWTGPRKNRQPYFIYGDELLAFAGVYDIWQRGDEELISYSIITTTPNDVMEPLHDRMPVILEPSSFEVWLEPDAEREDLEALLKPYGGKLEVYKVDKRVGKADANDAGLIKPVDEKEN
jgi:putative SOS response-associated peptidase YedK